jgi:hypothetical protein
VSTHIVAGSCVMREDPMPKLSLFVMRQLAADRIAVGAGLLISPSLALTALHVVCDTGEGLVVPPAARLGALRATRKIGGGAPLDEVFECRLVWPFPGAPALSGGWDIALLALDNKVIPDEIEKLPPDSADKWTNAFARLKVEQDCGRVTLGLDDEIASRVAPSLHRERRWTFGGYPAVARKLRAQALTALGKSNELDAPTMRTAEVSSLQPNPLTGYIEGSSAAIARPRADAAAADNPLAGASGGALYTLRDVGGVMRAFVAGVVSRAHNDGGDDHLSFAPTPRRNGVNDVGPDAEAAKAFWDIVASDCIVTRGALQRAMEELPYLDRRREVQNYFQGYDRRFGVYVYGFACTAYDLHDFLFKRLQRESHRPTDVGLAALFDTEKLTEQNRIRALREKDGDEAWSRAIKDIAAAIRADPDAGAERLDAIPRRLASGVHARVLQFVASPHELFDQGQATDWGRDTLNALLQSASQWAQAPLAPPAGQAKFSAPNPIVILLALVENDDDSHGVGDVRSWLGLARQLFGGGLTVPANVSCAFFERPLDVIDYEDFVEWYAARVDEVDADGARRNIAQTIDTPFQTEGHRCRKFRIGHAIDTLLWRRSS